MVRKKESKQTKKKEKKSTTISVKAKVPGPYDIIKMMFTDFKSFADLSDIILDRNSFMINRIFAIQFPEHAQIFNRMGMKGSNTVKAWQIFGLKTFGPGKVPGFVYIKANKNSINNNVSHTNVYTKEDINLYCKHYNISVKDFSDMLYFFPDSVKDKMSILTSLTTKEGLKQQISIEKKNN